MTAYDHPPCSFEGLKPGYIFTCAHVGPWQ